MLKADLINIEYLRMQAGGKAAREGLSYYRQGQARVLSAEAHKALIAVQGSQPRPYTVEIALQQQWLMVGCSCPQAAKGFTCKHAIAAAYQLRDYLIEHPPNPWREVLSASRPPRRRAGGATLLFSLVRRGTTWSLTAYTLPERALPDGALDD